jgi:WD40 repeat protein
VVQSVCVFDSGLVAAGYHSGIVVILAPQGSLLARFDGCLGKVNCMHASGTNLFVGGDDYIVRQFSAISTSANMSPASKFLGHSSPITSLHVSDDGYLYSGASDGSVRVWDILCRRKPGSPTHSSSVKFAVDDCPATAPRNHNEAICSLIGHNQSIQSIAVSPNHYVITGSSDMTIFGYKLKLPF